MLELRPHARAADGRVQPDGIDLNYLTLPVEETFFRMLRHREFDAAEMSLSSYVVSLFTPERPFIAIPVFPSRFFRHSCIYVHAGSGIREPRDLVGKRFGTPEYQMTAPVWIRGILADDYGVPVNSVTYYTGGLESPGRSEKLKLDLPPDIRVKPIGRGPDAVLDACDRRNRCPPHGAHAIHFRNGTGTGEAPVRRFRARRTRLFPPHRHLPDHAYRCHPPRRCYEREPWVAQSLYKAMSLAQRATYDDLSETAALKTMLPWLLAHLEETRREMGDDFWPYGLQRNRETLATFLRYSHEQGLSKERLDPERLFAPQTLETFKI